MVSSMRVSTPLCLNAVTTSCISSPYCAHGLYIHGLYVRGYVCGPDDIPAKLLKDAKDVVAPFLTLILNASLKMEFFLLILK